MIKVGLSGNRYSGKDRVASLFNQIGVPIFNADVILKFILSCNYEVLGKIKEKFGGLRFYINSGSGEIFNRISEAEDKSMEVCEVTGLPGKLRTDIRWYRTLCDEEYNKIKSKK